MVRRPSDQLNAGRAFYTRLLPGIDVGHFAPLWHLFTVGHLVTTDLDAIARGLGCSFADLDFLGTLAVDEHKPMRATDLASALYLSNAVLSTRVKKLTRNGLIERHPDQHDRRAYHLSLTAKGRALIESAIIRVEQESKLIRYFRQLDPADRDVLTRTLENLHNLFDREFVGTAYTDG